MRFAYALLSAVLATWPARAADLPELVLRFSNGRAYQSLEAAPRRSLFQLIDAILEALQAVKDLV